MSRANNLAVADLFFALGDRTRLSVVHKLGSDPKSATSLAEGAKVSRQAIVKHLQVLEGAGLVKPEKRGREVLYVLQPQKLREAGSYLEMISAGWDQAIGCLRDMVEEEPKRRY